MGCAAAGCGAAADFCNAVAWRGGDSRRLMRLLSKRSSRRRSRRYCWYTSGSQGSHGSEGSRAAAAAGRWRHQHAEG